MSKLALYRYYRPRSFSDVIGQPHIVSTLRNQVKNGNISHAYLFCGTRGTGKTSTAQILARAVNCLAPVDGEPCGHCAICALTSNPDVWEIDAASNNGVDQIRDLRDKVRFAPLESRYKVYIIDEVHMLSDGAFNALLKTLEEPPPHAVFILATTEPQKLPATILSRCQRFDFHRIDTEKIIGSLKAVLEDQGIQYDERALEKIALLADGGMRDALSMLDQCVAFAGDGLHYEQVLDILGNVDDGVLFGLTEALFSEQGGKVLQIVGEALQSGRDVGVMARDMMAYMRTLLLALFSDTTSTPLPLAEEEWQQRRTLASQVDIPTLLDACDTLARLDAQLRRATQPRLLLETALLRICLREQISVAVPAAGKASPASKAAPLPRPATPLPKQTIPPQSASNTANKTAADLPWHDDPPPPNAPPPENPNTVAFFADESEGGVTGETVSVLGKNMSSTASKAAVQPAKEAGGGKAEDAGKAKPGETPSSQSAASNDAQAVFDALVAKQGAGIQPIFKMYTWQHQMNGNTLEIVAPGNCLPALLQTLKNNVDNFSAALQDQYPGIAIKFVNTLSPDPALASVGTSTAEAPTVSAASPPTADTMGKDLFAAAVDLFGSDVVVRKD